MIVKKLDVSIVETNENVDDTIYNELKEIAISLAKHAYSPYSKFSVGVAVRLENNVIVGGCNQENVAYSSCLCAERVAISSAYSQYHDKKITHLLLCAMRDGEMIEQITPCGECRQVLVEREEAQGMPIKIIMYGSKNVYYVDSAKKILPLHFGQNGLK